MERFFYFLESEREHGLLVMDEVEKTEARRFVARLQRYFAERVQADTAPPGLCQRRSLLLPTMTYPVQAADICIYCLNWGFRLPTIGMMRLKRDEIADEFCPWLNQLQFHGEGYRDGAVFETFGIVYVPDPYTPR
ncbi:MAG: hypothetical protein M5U29_04605 [Anaerolineae bacterium]|nr:hypothetical protein [Anaerolineae bacterium]